MCIDCKYASIVDGKNRLICMCEPWIKYNYVSIFDSCDKFTPKKKEGTCYNCRLWEQGREDGTCIHYLNNDCPYGYHDEDDLIKD